MALTPQMPRPNSPVQVFFPSSSKNTYFDMGKPNNQMLQQVQLLLLDPIMLKVTKMSLSMMSPIEYKFRSCEMNFIC